HDGSLLLCAPRHWGGHSSGCAVVVAAGYSWRRPWVAGGNLGSGRPLQDCVCDLRGICQREDVSWAELEPRGQFAWATRAARFRVSGRTGFVVGWCKRRIDLECGADALRNTNAPGRSDFGGDWSAYHHRRNRWLRFCRLALYADAAAAITWLRIFDRLGARGAAINHSRTAWCADGASAVEAAA